MDQGRSLQLKGSRKSYGVPEKKRIVVGASDSADLQIRGEGVADIHCLIEDLGGKYKIYSLSPNSKVHVNGEEVVAAAISINDKIQLGEAQFAFDEVSGELPPETPLGIKKKRLPKAPQGTSTKVPPSAPDIATSPATAIVYDENYPLSKIEGAQFSEYIFEDAENIEPIFKYDVSKKAAEVIVLFKDKIISVDYIPDENGIYKLSGVSNSLKDIEFPYLGKEEKIPFIEIKNKEIFVNSVPGFKQKSFSESGQTGDNVLLSKEDILLFDKEDIKIFVKGDEAPPIVKSAPILRKDPEFKKYLILCLILVFAFISGVSLIEVDEEIEKEKVPERIARILYKPKQLRVTKKHDPIVKKSKKQNKVKSPSKQKVATKEQPKKIQKSKGDSTAKKVGLVKKGKPAKSTNKRKTVNKTPKRVAKAKGGSTRRKSTVKKVTKNPNYKGRVDTYKSVDFNSSISSLMAKGGALSQAAAKGGVSESYEDTSNTISSSGNTSIKRATVNNNPGSLTGATKGKLAKSFGTDGVTSKKEVFTAGIPERTIILGTMDRNDVLRILLENVPQFRYCYQKELDVRQAGISGILGLKFLIGPSGHVMRASVTSGENLPARVRGCMISHLKTIIFPRPKGGGSVEINTPFNLESKSL